MTDHRFVHQIIGWGRRRHLSVDVQWSGSGMLGRGRSLCGASGFVETDHRLLRSRGLCSNCERAARKAGLSIPKVPAA